MQSCAAGRDGLRFQSRQTAVPGPTRGNITARRLGRAAEVAVGRGQVGFVALGAMGTAEWRSQEVRDTNAGNRNLDPPSGAEVCLALHVHGACARATAFASLEILPQALQRG